MKSPKVSVIMNCLNGEAYLRQAIESVFKRMTWMSMLLFLLLVVIGDSAFDFVFGVKWAEAGVYSQILSFNIFFSFVMSPALTLIDTKSTKFIILHIGNKSFPKL